MPRTKQYPRVEVCSEVKASITAAAKHISGFLGQRVTEPRVLAKLIRRGIEALCYRLENVDLNCWFDVEARLLVKEVDEPISVDDYKKSLPSSANSAPAQTCPQHRQIDSRVSISPETLSLLKIAIGRVRRSGKTEFTQSECINLLAQKFLKAIVCEFKDPNIFTVFVVQFKDKFGKSVPLDDTYPGNDLPPFKKWIEIDPASDGGDVSSKKRSTSALLSTTKARPKAKARYKSETQSGAKTPHCASTRPTREAIQKSAAFAKKPVKTKNTRKELPGQGSLPLTWASDHTEAY